MRPPVRSVVRSGIFILMLASMLVGCSRDPNVRKQKYLESGTRFFEKGKYHEAAIQFSNAIQVDPDFAQAHYQLAQTYLKLQQYPPAYRELSVTVEKQPDNYPARIDLANLLIGGGEFKQAQEQLDVLAVKQPNNPLYHMALANYHAGLKDNAAALREMEKAIALDPNRADLYVNLALLQIGAQQFDAAGANFKKAVALDPKSMSAQLALGSFYQSRGQLAEAEQQYRHAIEVDPKSVDPRNALVRLLVIEGKQTEAEAFLKQTKRDLPDDPAAYVMLGDYYFSLLGDVNRASTEYESLYKDHPGVLQVRKNFIQLLILQNRLPEATKINDELLKTNPQNIDAMIFRAQIKIREGHPSEAVTALQEVLPRDPDNPVAHYHLGVAFDQLGNPTRAGNEWREAIRLKPDMIEAQRSLASAALRRGDWNALSEAAGAISAAQPNLPDGYALQAIAEINLKRRDQAETNIQKAIEVAPKNPIGYTQLGAMRLLENRYPDAEKAYQKVLELSPDSSDGLNGLMRVYLAQNNPDQAIAVANQQIQKVPNSSAFYDLLGTALFDHKKDKPGAEAALRKAIELDKTNVDAVLKLAQVLNAEGSTDQSFALLQQGVKDHPNDVPLYLMYGEMLESRRDWDNAKAAYQKILEIDSNNPIASNNLAFVMLQQGGNVDVALAMAQTARRGMPDSANAADTLGWAYYKKGAYGSAIGLLKEAVQKDPNDASFRYHLGLAYQGAGNNAQAKEQLQRVLKINPNFPDAEEVKKTLSGLSG